MFSHFHVHRFCCKLWCEMLILMLKTKAETLTINFEHRIDNDLPPSTNYYETWSADSVPTVLYVLNID